MLLGRDLYLGGCCRRAADCERICVASFRITSFEDWAWGKIKKVGSDLSVKSGVESAVQMAIHAFHEIHVWRRRYFHEGGILFKTLLPIPTVMESLYTTYVCRRCRSWMEFTPGCGRVNVCAAM